MASFLVRKIIIGSEKYYALEIEISLTGVFGCLEYS